MADQLDDIVRISEKTLMAPLVLAKNLEQVYNQATKIANQKGVSASIDSASTSTKKLKDETKLLTDQTNQLATIQKQMVGIIEKDNQAYKAEADAIANLNKATKERMTVSDKQLNSVVKIRTELDRARVAYAQLRTEEQRNSKEGQELLKTMQKLDKELVNVSHDTKKVKSETQNYTSILSKMKAELKEAQGEMAHIADTLGVDSDAYREAAQKAGELSDKIGDLKEDTKSLSGEPIERFSGSFDLLKSKVASLDLKGATLALKGMTQATKDLTFKAAAQGAAGFGQALSGLGKAILTHPIFLIVAVVVAIGVAIVKLKDKIKIIGDAFDAVGAVLDYVIGKVTEFTDWIGLTTVAFDKHTQSIIENAKKQQEAWSQLYDDQIKLASAAGESTLEAEKKKQEAIAATTNIAIQAFRARQQYGSKLTEEEQKELDALIKSNHDAEIELKAIGIRQQKENEKRLDEEAKKRKETALRRQGDAFKLAQFLLQQEIQLQQDIAKNEDASYTRRLAAVDKTIQLRQDLAKREMDEALKAENLTVEGRLLINEEYQAKLLEIEKDANSEKEDISLDLIAQQKEAFDKFLGERKDQIAQDAQLQQNALDDEINRIKEAGLAAGKTREEIDKEVLKKQKEFADDRVRIEIEAQEKILALLPEGSKERIAAEQALHDLRLQLTDAFLEQIEEREKTAGEKLLDFIDKWKGAYMQFASVVGSLFDGLTERRLQKLDEEKKAVTAQRDELLKQYEDDAQRQQSIKEQFAKKEQELEARKRKELRKQAIYEKAISLSMAGVNLAEAIIAMLQVGPAGFALSAAAAAIGAVQLAAIAAKPIPAAAKGIRNHKGLVIAGEQGTELIESPGRLSLTDSKATLYDVPAGTNIYPATHPRTLDAIAARSLPIARGYRGPVQSDRSKELKMLTQINKTISNKPVVNVVGKVVGYDRGSVRLNRLDALRNG